MGAGKGGSGRGGITASAPRFITEAQRKKALDENVQVRQPLLREQRNLSQQLRASGLSDAQISKRQTRLIEITKELNQLDAQRRSILTR